MKDPKKWAEPPANFRYILFERVNPARNESRFYYLAWQATLFDAGAVVRVYGRKDGQQRTMVTPFVSLGEAWPVIRRLIGLRLRRGYLIVEEATGNGANKR